MENYEIIGNIGKGSFGMVSKVRRKSDGKTFVWKELNYGRMSEKEKQQLVSEVNILRDLRHPHIVRYHDRIIDKRATKIYIIMEYCEGGDMGTLIKKCKKDKDYIAEDVIWKVLTQILSALYECHNRKSGKILHRDLKPANIFLDGQNNIKLGDFGLSKVMGDQSMFAYTHVGTPYYMSPEQINESKYNEKSDIWSAGCLLYEIAALRPPFEASNHLALALKIKEGKFERIPIRYSNGLQSLIEAMLNANPNRRASVEELMAAPEISMRIQEKRIRDKLSQAKQTENDLIKREEELRAREVELARKEEELRLLEQRLQGYGRRYSRLEDVSHSATLKINSENIVPEALNTTPSPMLYKKFETWRERVADADFDNTIKNKTQRIALYNSNEKSDLLGLKNRINNLTTRNSTNMKKVLGEITNLMN